MDFRYDIQGLRALAVLLVFIFHLNPNFLPGGFIGVDIFFVISGFLVGGIILEKRATGKFRLFDFYLGRLKRIVPVFLFFLLFVTLVGSFVYLNGDIASLRKNVYWAGLFNSNHYLSTLDNYFGASSIENPLLHTWTLSIEMQFYFLLPVLLLLVKRKYIVVVSIIITLILFTYSYCNSAFLNNKSQMYFSLAARIPEFLIGIIFYEYREKFKKLAWSNPLAFFALIGLMTCAIFYNEAMNFPGLWVIIPCLLAGVLLVLPTSRVNNILSNKVLVHIGELSYSIYLWHWAVMALMRYYKNEIEFTLYEGAFIILSTYIFSYLSFIYVETPFRKLENKKFFLRFSIVGLLLLISVESLSKINNYISPIPKEYSSPVFGLKSHASTFEKVEEYGALDNPKDSICLIGDSHALVYKRILDIIGKKQMFNFSTVSNNTYPTIPYLKEEDFLLDKLFTQYKSLSSPADSLIKNSKIIIFSSAWAESITSLPKAFEKFASEIRDDQILVVLSDFPVLDKHPLKMNRSIIRNDLRSINFKPVVNDIPDYVKKVVAKNSNVVIMSFEYDDFIEDIPFFNDTIMYYDKDHFNLYGTTKIGEKYNRDFLKDIMRLDKEKNNK